MAFDPTPGTGSIPGITFLTAGTELLANSVVIPLSFLSSLTVAEAESDVREVLKAIDIYLLDRVADLAIENKPAGLTITKTRETIPGTGAEPFVRFSITKQFDLRYDLTQLNMVEQN